jgi:hypothetical protein
MSNPPITLPTVKPKWKRSFQSTDISPSPSSSSDLRGPRISPSNESCTAVCPTCNENAARYTCPKCLAPYCSIACYKIHDVPSKSDHTSGAAATESNANNITSSGGGRCTEAFYREKVKQVSDLHVKDESNVSQMRDILTRSFYNDESNNEGEEGEGQIDEEVNGNQVNLTDEELMKLAACGLSLDVDSDHACDPSERLAQEEQLLQSLPLHLKLKFEQAVQRGELSHLVQNFHPFWLPKYNCDGDDMNENGRDFDGQLVSQPIDERILAIPPLPRLDSSLDSSLYSKPRVALQYNICEVIYVAAWTMRLYNTDTVPQLKFDASQQLEDLDLCTEMAFFLCTHSLVLSSDARLESVVEVLMECSGRTSEEMNCQTGIGGSHRLINSQDNSTLNSKILVNDMIGICRYRRVALKMLLIVVDMMERARKEIKNRDNRNHPDSKLKKRELMLAKKKVEFFTSWCNTYWDDCCNDIVDGAEGWQHDWVPSDEEKETANDLLLS